MTDYSVSCDAIALAEHGAVVSLVVYTDGEGFNSHVCLESDVSEATGPNVRTVLLDVQVWLLSLWRSERGMLFVSDEHGNVRLFDGTSWSVMPVSPDPLTCVWGLSETQVYAGGDEGVVYHWDGSRWSALSPPLGGTIFSIRGVAADTLYACGEEGLFHVYDGRGWTAIELPTNQRLLGLLARTASDVLVCGAAGVLFRGAGQSWTDISQPEHDFHDMTEYRGAIYLAGGGEGVFRLDGSAATNIKSTVMAYRLTANGEYLASSGDTLAARFDGTGWFGVEYN